MNIGGFAFGRQCLSHLPAPPFVSPLCSSVSASDLPSRHLRAKPVRLEELCRDTKFTKREIRVMYRGFKQVRLPAAGYSCGGSGVSGPNTDRNVMR